MNAGASDCSSTTGVHRPRVRPSSHPGGTQAHLRGRAHVRRRAQRLHQPAAAAGPAFARSRRQQGGRGRTGAPPRGWHRRRRHPRHRDARARWPRASGGSRPGLRIGRAARRPRGHACGERRGHRHLHGGGGGRRAQVSVADVDRGQRRPAPAAARRERRSRVVAQRAAQPRRKRPCPDRCRGAHRGGASARRSDGAARGRARGRDRPRARRRGGRRARAALLGRRAVHDARAASSRGRQPARRAALDLPWRARQRRIARRVARRARRHPRERRNRAEEEDVTEARTRTRRCRPQWRRTACRPRRRRSECLAPSLRAADPRAPCRFRRRAR